MRRRLRPFRRSGYQPDALSDNVTYAPTGCHVDNVTYAPMSRFSNT
jgi:hypothetical protein